MSVPARCCRAGPGVSGPRSLVLQALERHAEAYLARHRPSQRQRRVLRRLLSCRTAGAGAHLFVCQDCSSKLPMYNSCLDRHCPQCQGGATAAWLAARKDRMLPVPHFQVVFTLPAALRGIALRNQHVVYSLLFRVAASVLRDLAEQQLSARLGVLCVLHTWKTDVGYHPHLHCLVTTGGLQEEGERWVETSQKWLFERKVMGAMFRGRFMEKLIHAFERGELELAGEPEAAERSFRSATRSLSRKHDRWVVHVAAPAGRPVEHAVGYLARYVKSVAIGDGRILAISDRTVTIATRQGPRVLDGVEFVRRFLLHVLPAGFRKVRYYGLYAPGNVKLVLQQARELVEAAAGSTEDEGQVQGIVERDRRARQRHRARPGRCPICGSRQTHRVFFFGGGVVRASRGPP